MTSRPSIDEVSRWVGLVVQDSGGEELGRCIRAYRDDETGQAEWLVIETRSGSGEHFVPTRDARQEGGAVRIAWTEAVVLATPSLGSPDQVGVDDEGLLYAHYGIPTPAQDLEGGSESGQGQGQARSRGRLVRLGAASDTDTIPPADLSSASSDLSSASSDLSSESVEPLVVTSEAEEAPATAALAPQASAPQDEALQDEPPVAAAGSPEAPEPVGTDAGQQPETAASQTSTGRGAQAARAGGVLVPVLLAGAAGAWRWQRIRQQRAAKQRAIRIASGPALLVPAAAAAAIFLGRRRRGEDAQWQRAEETPAVPVVIDLEQERGLRTETPAAESLEQTDSIDLHEGLDIPTVRDPDSLR